MPKTDGTTWMRGGAAFSLVFSALGYLTGRRLAGRIALAFAVAFLERLRESRLSARVYSLLARAGRNG